MKDSAARILISPVGDFWYRSSKDLPGVPLHRDDGSHPNQAGTWFKAMTLLGTIGGRECIVKANWKPELPAGATESLKKLLLDHPEIFHNAAKP